MNKYKLIVSNNNFYREIELPIDAERFRLGTHMECDYRLHRDLFFDEVLIEFKYKDNKWNILCSDNTFISLGDTRKLFAKEMMHGDIINVKYQDSENLVFAIEFITDFDSKKRNFERRIDVGQLSKIAIGSGEDNNIVLKSKYVINDKIELTRDKESFILNIIDTTYGVYHNGKKTVSGTILNDGDFLSISDYLFYYKENGLYIEIDDNIGIKNLTHVDNRIKNNYPIFYRNTRIKTTIDRDDIEILDPPAKPQKPKSNVLISILSSVGMFATAGIMAYMGGTMLIFSVVSGIIAIIITFVGVFQSKKEYKISLKERREKYSNYIDKKKKDIEMYREEERKKLNKIYPSMEENLKKFDEFSSELFDRSKDDEDFLHIRLGTGSIEAVRKIKYKKQERLEIEDDLQEVPQKLYDEYKMIHNAPVVCSLKDINALGITGNKNQRYEFFKNMVLDIVARQFYTEVKMFFVVSVDNSELIYNMRFLPYVNINGLNIKGIVSDDESKKIVYEHLYSVMSERETNRNYEDNYIVFLFDRYEFGSHPVSKFVDKAKDLGVTFIFFEDCKEKIPMGCEKLVTLLDNCDAELIDTSNDRMAIPFSYKICSEKQIARITQIVAAVQTEEISLESSLTKKINIFSLLDIYQVEDLDLSKRWNKSVVYNSMAVPIGVSKTGIMYLDIHDQFHGPHGLVAGTTGSGKSELLQTYILSIATLFHPYEVAFVIIDFKGGGMVNQFVNLPHLLGTITNIDGKEIDRSLRSIKAELQKRQVLFAEAEVNHIDKYIKKYKNGEISIPLPHLIIIVDEFAELKAEQPDFMKELISAARIGRSLGVHLILATQKPAGQVDEQIWSNSRFKLCLKVQGVEDSNEVIKSPLAAEIKEPGRAYLQVGNNEIFELFQSAYSGDSEENCGEGEKTFKLFELALSGKRTLVYEKRKQSNDGKGKTQLEAIVDYINDYCKQKNIAVLPSICLESLNSKLFFDEESFLKNKEFIIGIYDDPDNQYQGNAVIDIDGKNTFIIGASQYGKTNLLQLFVKQISIRYSPKQANIYILDFGSMVLKGFEQLNHIGGVVCLSDDEKLKNFFKYMLVEIKTRKEKLISKGVSSFTAYCDAGEIDLPKIYIMLDNMTAFMELYPEYDDSLLNVIREGVSVGISIIVTNSHSSGISYKYLSNFANKIALYCNETSEYGNFYEHIVVKPEDVPGRCIIEIDKHMVECQSFLAFKGEKEHERIQEIKNFISKNNDLYVNQWAQKIPHIPSLLTNEIMKHDYCVCNANYKVATGLTYSDVTPFYLDLSKLGALGVCGGENKGHRNFICNILNILNKNKQDYPVRVTILDDISRKYKKAKEVGIVEEYTLDVDVAITKMKEWYEIIQERYLAMLEEKETSDNSLLLLIVQNNDFAKRISDDMTLMSMYNDIVTKYKMLNICIIYSNYCNGNVSYDAPEPLRMIKQDQHLILFDDLDYLKVFDVPYEELKANKKRLQLGDAYYIRENIINKVKLVKSQ